MDLGDDGPVPFADEGIGRSGRSVPLEGRMFLLRWGLSSLARLPIAPWCDRRLPKVQGVTMSYG